MAEAQTTPSELSPLKRALLALDKMQARLDALEGEKREPIAILGIGCRFPGGVETAEAFWNMLAEGRDAVARYPETHPGAEAWLGAAPNSAMDALIRHGGYLSDVAGFDPGFFGISPREAMRMDPQQRLFLQTACEALEGAGLPLENLAGSRTGVFVGIHSQSNDYYQLQTGSPEAMDTYTSTGTAHSIVANRLSYALDLRGPSLAVDTACSSSLVSLHLACQSLRQRECDLALAGGVNLILSPETSLAFTRLEFLSPDGRCKTFDAGANGFVRAEGCGVVVLKRLSEARRDRDPILAVVRGTAVNQDGTTNGLTAPNGLSQQAVIRAALENGRVDPTHVTLIETHGTGTALGDPIEVDALRAVYGDGVHRALGAVKSNMGHAEAAAGIAGVIKAVLALHHGAIPRNLHFQRLNPHIRLDGSSLYIPLETTPWPPGPVPRCAGVSSFGFGGTNGHVILQEAPARAEAAPAPAVSADEPYLVPVSARSEPALRAALERWLGHLDGHTDTIHLRDIAHTAALRRSHHPHRAAVVARSSAELRGSLAALTRGETPAGSARHSHPGQSPRVAFVLCGQGPQWWAMGRELFTTDPVFREAIERCAAEMAGHVSWSLLEELGRDEATARLSDTEIAQPALFAMHVALAARWRAWGIEPHAIVGHSVGEVAAAHLAGVLTLPDAVRVICARGRIMQAATGTGRMAALELPESEVDAMIAGRCNDVAVAAINSPNSTVISGTATAVADLCAEAQARGARTKLLPVNYAFHSPQMEPFRTRMADAVRGIATHPAEIPVISTVSGRPAVAGDFGPEYWGHNIRRAVRFAPAVKALLDEGIDTFLELGPHPTLVPMILQCAEAAGRAVVAIDSLRARQPERQHLLASLAALYVRGATVRWKALAPADGAFVPLPPYPWQNRRLWLEAGVGATPSQLVRRARAAGAGAPEALMHELAWVARPSATAVAVPAGAPWTVVGSTEESNHLVEVLRARGSAVQLIASPAQLASALPGDSGGTVVYLAPSTGALAGPEAIRAQLAQALTVMHTLSRGSAAAGSHLWVVTRQSQPVQPAAELDLAGSALWGLARVFAAENPDRWGGLIDLSADEHGPSAAAHVIAAITQHDGEDEMVLRGGLRHVPRLRPQSATAAHPLTWDADGCHIITGGLGGLGLHVARWLATQGARRLLLLGRTPLPPRREWASLLASDRAHAPTQAILAIEQQGCDVRTAAVDVADPAALERALVSIRAEGWTTIHGVVHAAGAIADRLIPELDERALTEVLRAKVDGTLSLERALTGQPLRYFACFSSFGSQIGMAGQGAYAAANAFLDGFAHTRRARGLPVRCINWGGWAGAGFADSPGGRLTLARLEERGIRSFTPVEGLGALGSILQRDAVQTTVVHLDAAALARSAVRAPLPAILREFASAPTAEETAAPAATDAREAVRKRLLSLDTPERRLDELAGIVRTQIARTLKLEADTIAPDQPLGTLGLDSLTSFELKNRCEQAFGLSLPATLAWNYPTVQALTEHLAGRLDLPLTDAPAPAVPAAPAAAASVGPELDELSDEQALRSLMKRRSSA